MKRTVEIVQINPGLNIIGQPHVITVHKGVASVITFTGIGGQIGKYVFALLAGFGTVPTGMAFADNGDGTATISGTPTAYGDFPLTMTLENNGRAVKKSFIIRAPALTLNLIQSSPVYSGVAITPGQLKLEAKGGSGTGYTYSLATYGGFVDSVTGDIRAGGTLTQGTYTDTATVVDSASNTVSVPIGIIVLPRVVITDLSPPPGEVSTAYSYQFKETGATGTVTWSSSGSLPSGLSLDTATGILSGFPTTSPQTVTPTITASDSGTGDSFSTPVSISIYPQFHQPGAIAAAAQATLPMSLEISSFLTGGVPPYKATAISITAGHSWLVVDLLNSRASGVPPVGDIGVPFGLTYSAVDALGFTASGSASITIIDPPNPSLKIQQSGSDVGGPGPNVLNFVGPTVTDDGLGGRVMTFGSASALAADTDGTLAANSDANVATQKATKTYADTKLAKSANLSDVTSASTARTNLGLGGAAVLNVGTTAGTVAAGDDSRFGAGGGSQLDAPLLIQYWR